MPQKMQAAVLRLRFSGMSMRRSSIRSPRRVASARLEWGQLLNRAVIPGAGKLDGIGPALYANSEQLDLINQTMDGIRVWP
jgi:hypothetical protein